MVPASTMLTICPSEEAEGAKNQCTRIGGWSCASAISKRPPQAEGESGLATQHRTLNDHGLRDDRIFTDVASGRNMRRPSWRTLREKLKPGDTVVVPRIDRLARNLTEGLKTIEELHGQGINSRSLAEGLDTGDDSPTSRLMLHMLLSLAEWERDTIRDRIKAGVDRAAAEGRTGGRPPVLSSEKVEAVRSFLENGGAVSAAARTFGVSCPTVRAVRDGTYTGQYDIT
jgi:DNA invertase Pin-like site-specific DNA recombinase